MSGRRTSFAHAHLREEELVYVLSGTPTLRWIEDGVAHESLLAPGDFVAFPAYARYRSTYVVSALATAPVRALDALGRRLL